MAEKEEVLRAVHALKDILYPNLKDCEPTWKTVDLGFHATVQVCPPLAVTVDWKTVWDSIKLKYKDDKFAPNFDLVITETTGRSVPLFLPVTKKDTWEMAQHFSKMGHLPIKAYPLTQKVMDRIYSNTSGITKVPYDSHYTAGEKTDNFVAYAKYLQTSGATPDKLFSGAIKNWILSNVKSVKSAKCNPPDYKTEDPSVNYGMYSPLVPKGRIQGAASCHDQNHHDYSQILQLMRNFKVYDAPFDMDIGLLTAHPGLFNELVPYNITKSDQKYLALSPPVDAILKTTSDLLKGRWTVTYPGYDDETYTFTGNKVSWSDTAGGKGDGFWAVKNQKVTISWQKTGAIEFWALDGSSTTLNTTLNYFNKGQAVKA